MIHPSDDDLTLHYYRDPGCGRRVEAHLEACGSCAGRYRQLAATLDAIPPVDVPSRDDRYGLEVWHRIRHRLPDRDAYGWHAWTPAQILAAAASLVLLTSGAFMLGRAWPPADDGTPRPQAPVVATIEEGASRRALLLTVADHLERSDRVLTEIMNASDDGDISAEQGTAQELLWEGRLYRQFAVDADERAVAAMLDDLERALLDIVHSPSRVTSVELQDARRRVESAALLFKVRVMRNDLNREGTPTSQAS